MLTETEERFVQRVSSRHRYTIVAGIALFVVGGLYAIWGVQQLDPKRAPNPQAAFDRPIARLALLAADYRERLDRGEPQTAREETLLTQLKTQTDMTVRLVLVLLRFLLGSMVFTGGVIVFAVGLTQRQFLGIIGKRRQV
ncbi:MAG: hypothetical protein ACE5IQ_11710 [Candidatus Methylomirabilales bacterium]